MCEESQVWLVHPVVPWPLPLGDRELPIPHPYVPYTHQGRSGHPRGSDLTVSCGSCAVVGEIDVPGHSTALVNAYPEVFGFASKPALGIINFVNETTIAAIETLLDEIAAVFPSPIAHTGGDEVSLSELDDLPEIQAAISAHHVNNSYDLYRMFIARMHSYASSRNRTLHVWEGFAPQGGQTGRSAHPASSVVIPTDVVVEPFDCYYYNPPQLALDGYKVRCRSPLPTPSPPPQPRLFARPFPSFADGHRPGNRQSPKPHPPRKDT